MREECEERWLVEVFLQYQEALDKNRKLTSGRNVLRDALESDRRERSSLTIGERVVD